MLSRHGVLRDFVVVSTLNQMRMRALVASSSSKGVVVDKKVLLTVLAEGGVTVAVGKWIHSMWKTIWMTDKIVRSTNEIEEWLAQWEMVQPRYPRGRPFEMVDKNRSNNNRKETDLPQKEQELLDDSSRQLIEYAMKNGPKVSRSCSLTTYYSYFLSWQGLIVLFCTSYLLFFWLSFILSLTFGRPKARFVS
jgi:hypothetical protein